MKRTACERIARSLSKLLLVGTFALVGFFAWPIPAGAVVSTPPGYVFDPLVLGSPTQSCVAAGPGGTFVGVGPGFTANAQAVVFVKESGEARLVAFGFNSIGDCAYDRATDALYVTDNASPAELPGALGGDTVFRVPDASAASALSASGLELVPGGSVPFAASVTVAPDGSVLVGNAAGGGAGEVLSIDPVTAAVTTFAGGFDFTGGLAVHPPTSDVFVAEALGTFESQITRFDSSGSPVPPVPFAGPSFGFGSFDLAFDLDGRLLATGAFGGDVVAFELSGTSQPFVGGLTFATGVSVDPFTGRVSILSSFSGTDEDRTVHRFVPVSRLVRGGGRKSSDCLHEFYGVALAPLAPGKPPKHAVCTDGDLCDADGKADDRCLFPLGFCLLVDDPALPECSVSTAVEDVALRVSPNLPTARATSERVSAALPLSASRCFFTDGIEVPVRVKKSGEKKPGGGKVRVAVRAADGRRDRDALRLVCLPSS
ncbi:MAG: hypothetical protein KatS3mg076_2386 [Candidatus Binatia bacterium]|nr:MAG: hypothetical protein KatS3mg076_2386 [Candidatus Binatia bacterium]